MNSNNQNLFGQWQPPAHWQTITSLDCHTGGEPLRIITSGFPVLKGKSILAMRRDCLNNHDHLRTALMFEPRGHSDMYGAIITPAEREDSDFGVIFMHNEGYSTMCGHAMMALVRASIEAGVVKTVMPTTCIKIDAPCGQITAYADIQNTQIARIYFDNVASFVAKDRLRLPVKGIGEVEFTLAYGGAFYAYVDATPIQLSLAMENHQQIIDYGMRIKAAVMASEHNQWIKHPYEADLSFLYGTIFYAPVPDPAIHSRNVCIFAEGELDRSPTGSGVSGRAAILVSRGELKLQDSITIESIVGSRFQVTALKTCTYGDNSAIIPRVAGDACVIGKNTFYINPDDPFSAGFAFSRGAVSVR